MSSESALKSEILYALYQLEPVEFEEFIGELWKQKGWKTDVTDHFNDNGIDIIAHRDTLFSQKYLIQAKRFGPDKKITKHHIEKYSHLKEVDDKSDAIIIITTSSFTKTAEQRANVLNIKLVDGPSLASFILESKLVDIVEQYSEESILSELKSSSESAQAVNNGRQPNTQHKQPHPSAESDISRKLTGLKWIKRDDETLSQNFFTSNRNVVINDGVWRYQPPVCPDCESSDVNKNGTRERSPKGSCLVHPEPEGSVELQQYRCTACNNSFGTTLPFVEDGYRYIDDLREMVKITYAVSGLSIPMLQLICLFRFDVMPSDQRIHEWRTISTGGIVTNQLPSDIYSGHYTYDEQILELRNKRSYRLLLYDIYRRVPVAEQVVESPKKDVIRSFLQTAVEEKPCKAITTDGRPGIEDIIQNDIDTGHYRCLFHLIENFQESIDRRLKTSRPSGSELLMTAIIGGEFKQIFESDSHNEAIQRLESIKEKSDFLPKYIRKYINKVDKNRNKFLGCLKNRRIPRTVKSCERYFSHSQSSVLYEKSLEAEAMQAFLARQMVLRTVREGLIPHSRSVKLIRDNYTEIKPEQVKKMYTERKKQFLAGENLRGT